MSQAHWSPPPIWAAAYKKPPMPQASSEKDRPHLTSNTVKLAERWPADRGSPRTVAVSARIP
eukprot:12409214-Heterocapsa_arctica.AAC.1